MSVLCCVLLALAAIGFATDRLRFSSTLERRYRRQRADLRRVLRRP